MLVNPEYVATFKPVGSSCVGQISDLRGLGVRFVLVSPGPIASIEPHKGWDSSLPSSGVTTSLGVSRPAHPLVVEDGVGSHLVRHDDGLEGVGLNSQS